MNYWTQRPRSDSVLIDTHVERLNETICNNIRFFRERRGYTQAKLANMCGITPEQLSDTERGRFTCTLETIAVIAKALKVKPHELLDPRVCG